MVFSGFGFDFGRKFASNFGDTANLSLTMPSLAELTQRYEAICESLQDSVRIIEGLMGREENFSFDFNREIESLGTIDLLKTEHHVESFIKILQEYKRMLANERKRRRLRIQIDDISKLKTKREDLKKIRQTRRVAVNPYKKKGKSIEGTEGTKL